MVEAHIIFVCSVYIILLQEYQLVWTNDGIVRIDDPLESYRESAYNIDSHPISLWMPGKFVLMAVARPGNTNVHGAFESAGLFMIDSIETEEDELYLIAHL